MRGLEEKDDHATKNRQTDALGKKTEEEGSTVVGKGGSRAETGFIKYWNQNLHREPLGGREQYHRLRKERFFMGGRRESE